MSISTHKRTNNNNNIKMGGRMGWVIGGLLYE